MCISGWNVERKKICRRHVCSSPPTRMTDWLLSSHTPLLRASWIWEAAQQIPIEISIDLKLEYEAKVVWMMVVKIEFESFESQSRLRASFEIKHQPAELSSSTQSSFQQTLSQDSHKSPWTTTATLPLLLDPVDDSKSCLRLVACRRHQQQTPTPTLWWCTLQPQAMTRPPHRYCSVANE